MAKFKHLYKGYVPLKTVAGEEKAPAIKANDCFVYFEDVENSQGVSGILNEHICYIDTDDSVNTACVDRILKFLNLKVPTLTTTKGKHYYFTIPSEVKLTSGSKLLFASGFVGDIKVGNSLSFDVIKYKGSIRTFENLECELQPLPKFFKPLGKEDSLSKAYNISCLTDLDEGDGRNDILFRFIIPLKNDGFSKKEIEFIYQFIINTCVFKQPLRAKEISTILRKEAFDNVKEKKEDVRADISIAEFTRELITDNFICFINGVPRYYDDGVYKELSNVAIGYLATMKKDSIKEQTINEIRHKIDYFLFDTKDYPVDEHRICFKNGNFNILSGELEPHSPKIIVVNKIPFDYNPNAYCREVDETLNKIACEEPDTRMLFNEMIGAMLNPICNFAKAFVLVGDGANGKSTLLELLKNSLGGDNVGDLDLKDLSSTFRPSLLVDKMVNIGDDISAQFLDDTANFKKLVTGETVILERKGIQPKAAKLTVKLLFAANNLPRIKNFGSAILRRLVIVPCMAKFNHQNSNFDVNFRQKLNSTEAYEYVLKVGIDALQKLYQNNGKFTETQKTIDAGRSYELENNPIKAFAEELPIEEWHYKNTDYIYDKYCSFCIENRLKSNFSKIGFSRKVKEELGVTTKLVTVDFKRVKVYCI